MRIISDKRIVIIFLAIGLCSIFLIPSIKFNTSSSESEHSFSISYQTENSTPDIVEQKITSILENSLSQIPEIKNIQSSSTYNRGSITISFNKRVDLNIKKFEIVSVIRQVFQHLPPKTSFPEVVSFHEQSLSASDLTKPLLIYTISSTDQPEKMKMAINELLIKPLAGIGGFKGASLSGLPSRMLSIKFDINKANAYNISPSKIAEQLREKYAQTYIGAIHKSNGEELFMKIAPQYPNLYDIENIILSSKAGIVKVKDIATLSIEDQPSQSFFRVNGQNAITLRLFSQKNSNTIDVSKSLLSKLTIQQHQLPPGYHLKLNSNEADHLEKEIDTNKRRGLLSFSLLALFILISYRSWKHLLSLLVSLIINVLITLLIAFLLKIDFNLYTISGIAISFGIMIDNAIVLLDYSKKGKGQTLHSVLIAASLTNIAALVAIFFLPDEQKNILYDFAVIIILTLFSSMIVGLFFTPSFFRLVDKLVPGSGPSPTSYRNNKKLYRLRTYYRSAIIFITKKKAILIILLILTFGIPTFLIPGSWKGNHWYHTVFNNTIGNEYFKLNIRPYADKLLGGTLYMFKSKVLEKSSYRADTRTVLYVNAELPIGSTPDQMNFVFLSLEKMLYRVKEIETFVTNITSGQAGTLQINFKSAYENTDFPDQLKTFMIRQAAELGGVEWNIYGVGKGFNNDAGGKIPSYRVMLKGYNYDQLERMAFAFREKISQNDRVKKVNINDRLGFNEREGKEYILSLNKGSMTNNNITSNILLAKLQQMYNPILTAQSVKINEQDHPIIIEEASNKDRRSYDLLNALLSLDSSRDIRIRDVGQLELANTAAAIHKEDRQYIRIVSFDYMGGAEFGDRYLSKIINEAKPGLPLGYSMEENFWGENWNMTHQQYWVIAYLIISIYFICSILFESLILPLLIILMIPISFTGIFLIFSFGEYYFDQGGYAAFIMLGVLVTNSSIFIINDYKYLAGKRKQKNGMLIIHAVFNRSRTIILTTISTICGLLPFIIEGQHEVFWFSFSIGTLGGLLFSILSLFFILPCLLLSKRSLK